MVDGLVNVIMVASCEVHGQSFPSLIITPGYKRYLARFVRPEPFHRKRNGFFPRLKLPNIFECPIIKVVNVALLWDIYPVHGYPFPSALARAAFDWLVN